MPDQADYSRDAQPLKDYYAKPGTTAAPKEVGLFIQELLACVAEDEKGVSAGSRHEKYERPIPSSDPNKDDTETDVVIVEIGGVAFPDRRLA